MPKQTSNQPPISGKMTMATELAISAAGSSIDESRDLLQQDSLETRSPALEAVPLESSPRGYGPKPQTLN